MVEAITHFLDVNELLPAFFLLQLLESCDIKVAI